jgi:hypothetical protein
MFLLCKNRMFFLIDLLETSITLLRSEIEIDSWLSNSEIICLEVFERFMFVNPTPFRVHL